MEMSDFTWQHQKYASPEMYVNKKVKLYSLKAHKCGHKRLRHKRLVLPHNSSLKFIVYTKQITNIPWQTFIFQKIYKNHRLIVHETLLLFVGIKKINRQQMISTQKFTFCLFILQLINQRHTIDLIINLP